MSDRTKHEQAPSVFMFLSHDSNFSFDLPPNPLNTQLVFMIKGCSNKSKSSLSATLLTYLIKAYLSSKRDRAMYLNNSANSLKIDPWKLTVHYYCLYKQEPKALSSKLITNASKTQN